MVVNQHIGDRLTDVIHEQIPDFLNLAQQMYILGENIAFIEEGDRKLFGVYCVELNVGRYAMVRLPDSLTASEAVIIKRFIGVALV